MASTTNPLDLFSQSPRGISEDFDSHSRKPLLLKTNSNGSFFIIYPPLTIQSCTVFYAFYATSLFLKSIFFGSFL